MSMVKKEFSILKLIVLMFIVLLPFVGLICYIILPDMEERLLEQKYRSTQNKVETIYRGIEYFDKMVKDSVITLKEAQTTVANMISTQRYDENNYFWINNLVPELIVHPLRPKRIGTDVSDFLTADGSNIYLDFIKLCKEEGEGFIEYIQNRPGYDKPLYKVSYIKLYKPWEWIIGTGFYIEKDWQEHKNYNRSIYYLLLGTLMISFLLGYIGSKII